MEPLSPVQALVIVDVQPTFCEEGPLPVEGGNQVAANIAALVNSDHKYALVITTQDWHIEAGNHFSNDPDFIDSWPPHGVADSPDAALHPALSNATQHIDRGVRKGQYAAAYSGFEGTTEDGISLLTLLRDAEIANVDVVGLAFDHCVRATALDAAKEGFTTKVLVGLTASVANDTAAAARVELRGAGVILEE